MRTDELIIPKGMPREGVLAEADFYCITTIVALLLLDVCPSLQSFFSTILH